MDLFAELVAVTAAFDSARIDYAVCGGIALAIHGAPRATRDIGVMARAADLARLREVVRQCGFAIEALPMTFSATGVAIHRFKKIEPDGATLMLDVLVADGPLEAVWQTRTRIAVTGAGEVTVVSREGLISLKLTAGRPQDLVDIQRLQEVARGEG
ncbi:MAG: nucleotidyl transferase AbiEii/AbiGii toxin family protein [Kofleriaceae bacterium]